jgi:hypothetical protein
MLTYSKYNNKKRTDRPWLLFVLTIIWVMGTVFFHAPWEPYEPFVFAVVKGIIKNDNWLVPYVSNAPYLDIQPFYFWIFASIIKFFNITNNLEIANTIRIINTTLIFLVIYVVGLTGSSLSAYKNGRTVILILISTVGFINSCYQLSPNIFVILGFALFIYSLQKSFTLPGISGWLLFLGLFLISINFTCEYLLLGLITLIILPLMSKIWRTKNYFITITIGIILFAIIFYLYVYELQKYDTSFYSQWANNYINIFPTNKTNIWARINELLRFILWFLIPTGFLVLWTIYKRKLNLFKDHILQINIILLILTLIYNIFSTTDINNSIFPIVIFMVYIASVEVDSIRITIVSLFNWFSIFIFGFIGIVIWFVYIFFNIDKNNNFFTNIWYYTQNYHYRFNFYNLFLALIITAIWIFMITRKHIKGREMITNWASGSTFVLILFLALCLPCFDNILTFRYVVMGSLKYLDNNKCIATNSDSKIQIPLWAYYSDINLMPSFLALNNTVCEQAIVATDNPSIIDKTQWKIVYQNRRPIDKKTYYVLTHINQ